MSTMSKFCPSLKAVRLAGVVAGTTVLSACALPLPLQVASLLADGISYLTTEKTLTDHGLSAVTGQDCALLRGLSGDEPCREIDAVAVAEGPVVVAAPVEPVETATTEMQTDIIVVGTPTPERKIAYPNPDNGLYLIIGSFVNPSDAARHAAHQAQKLTELNPKILPGTAKGVPVYRVGVGPLTGEDLPVAREFAGDLGIADAWPVKVTLPPLMLSRAPDAPKDDQQAFLGTASSEN